MARSGSVPDAAPLQPRLTLPSPAPLPRRSAPPARQKRREQHHSLQDLQSKLTEPQRRIDTDFICCEHLAAGLKRETLNPATTASRELTPTVRRVNTASLATTQRIFFFFQLCLAFSPALQQASGVRTLLQKGNVCQHGSVSRYLLLPPSPGSVPALRAGAERAVPQPRGSSC